jgi:hypothetical protein
VTALGTPGKSAARAATFRTHLVKSELSGITVGVDALRVSAIEDAEETGPAGVHTVDLAGFLGLAAAEPREEGVASRRALLVRAGDRVLRLVIGEAVRVEALAPEAIRPVPVFIATLAASAGIGSLFLVDDGLGYIMDIDRLGEVLATKELSR